MRVLKVSESKLSQLFETRFFELRVPLVLWRDGLGRLDLRTEARSR